jgi:hypothetical protein
MAVKSSRPEVFRGLGDRELFVREAEAWVSLGLHPNICACHYVRVIAGVPRVFAEYVDGGSPADWIGDGRLYACPPDLQSAGSSRPPPAPGPPSPGKRRPAR